MATSEKVLQVEPGPPLKQRRSTAFTMALAMIAAAGVGSALYFGAASQAGFKSALKYLNENVSKGAAAATAKERPAATAPHSKNSQAGVDLVSMTRDEEESIGFKFEKVKAQTEPIRLELTGRTAYDDQTITKVRPRFDTRVEKVLAIPGQKVKKGEPLVELYSTDLAQSKTDFQNKYVQWQHDLKLYNLRTKLVKEGGISQQLMLDTENDEEKSRNDFSIALDKLTVFYEVPKAEIDPLIERLSDKTVDPRKFGTVGNKARMTLLCKTDGYVIARTVVPQNYYESTDTLMEIAPLDHLWVWVNVFELDQDKVHVGQTLEIQFPFMAQTIQGHVDYVAPEVSKDTRAVKIRATIPNPDARLKSDMLVKAMLEIPPVPGQTVIPRISMVALSGGEYVFVKVPSEKNEKGTGSTVDRFRRVKIQVGQENTDSVVVASGLEAGQEVAMNGSLILSQLFEDQMMTDTGLPAH